MIMVSELTAPPRSPRCHTPPERPRLPSNLIATRLRSTLASQPPPRHTPRRRAPPLTLPLPPRTQESLTRRSSSDGVARFLEKSRRSTVTPATCSLPIGPAAARSKMRNEDRRQPCSSVRTGARRTGSAESCRRRKRSRPSICRGRCSSSTDSRVLASLWGLANSRYVVGGTLCRDWQIQGKSWGEPSVGTGTSKVRRGNPQRCGN